MNRSKLARPGLRAPQRRPLLLAAHRARLAQLAFLPATPFVGFLVPRIERSQGYDLRWYTTYSVPALMIAALLGAAGLSLLYHWRLRAAGCAGTADVYDALPVRTRVLTRRSLFLLLVLLGVVVLVASGQTSGTVSADLSEAGTATVSVAVVARLLWMLGAWVVHLERVGAVLAQQAEQRPSAGSRRFLTVLGRAPGALMLSAISLAFSEVARNIPWLVGSLVGLVVSLAGTCLLGLRAGYSPPGQRFSRRRLGFLLVCLVAVVVEVLRSYVLWIQR